MTTSAYWEERARRFSGRGAGLRAVCSYGMPDFYNGAVHLAQRRALARWLRVASGTRALDAGCGVGRWSRLLARGGAQVTGVDLSPTMIEQARRRAEREGVSARCRFLEGDLSSLQLGERFPLVVAVTVLQHVVDPQAFHGAVDALGRHLAPGGRLVLLEAAPSRPRPVSEHPVFRVRTAAEYVSALAQAGLRCVAVTGVDAPPLKILFLPRYARLPRLLGLAGLAVATLAGMPLELVAGRRWVAGSWHKVFVCERAS